jgi:hypothetical protein
LDETPQLYQTDLHRAVACFLYAQAPALDTADMDSVFQSSVPTTRSAS